MITAAVRNTRSEIRTRSKKRGCGTASAAGSTNRQAHWRSVQTGWVTLQRRSRVRVLPQRDQRYVRRRQRTSSREFPASRRRAIEEKERARCLRLLSVWMVPSFDGGSAIRARRGTAPRRRGEGRQGLGGSATCIRCGLVLAAPVDDYEKVADTKLQKIIDDAAELSAGVKVTPVLCEGQAASVLCAQAAGVDLLVVGSRGLGGFRGFLLGSVGQECAHHANVPCRDHPARARRDEPSADIALGFARLPGLGADREKSCRSSRSCQEEECQS